MKKGVSVFLVLAIGISFGLIQPLIASKAPEKDKANSSASDETLSETDQIEDVLQKITSAFVDQDLDEIAKYIHKKAVYSDDAFHETYKGRDAVLDHFKQRFRKFSPKGRTPIISMNVGKPKIIFKGKKAIANYVARTALGGSNPRVLSSETTEEFVKDDGQWKSIKYSCHWTEDHRKYLESGSVNPRYYVKLTGGTKTLLVSLHGIKALGVDIKKTRESLQEYIKEASRKKLVVVETGGNVVGPIIDISKDARDYLPVRKENLDLHLKELTTLIKSMKLDVDRLESGALTLVIRKDIRKEMNSLVKKWVSEVKRTDKHCKDLGKVTSKNVEDNELLVAKAKVLRSDINELKQIQKQMLRTFRKPTSSIR